MTVDEMMEQLARDELEKDGPPVWARPYPRCDTFLVGYWRYVRLAPIIWPDWPHVDSPQQDEVRSAVIRRTLGGLRRKAIKEWEAATGAAKGEDKRRSRGDCSEDPIDV